ncbi:tyrosine-type recombinase/integrase [Caryophanon tenue]|uniref:Tyr recombinase domain-containing protein n=1 Tax=Caryophanon tenue TaxID=33978 RepID=A0A1C0YKW2_9BACL|nr:tyrosine-type recombinase/integrase [Caryophanon tenue]OCS87816.1 hypothetical protein A6M13_10990 [Caryophanon tenue]
MGLAIASIQEEKALSLTVLYRGVEFELFIETHFNQEQREIFRTTKLGKDIFNKDLHYFTDINSLSKSEKTYAYKLALMGRIQLDKQFQSSPINYKLYPLEILPNFKLAYKLFEDYIDDFAMGNLENKDNFRKLYLNELLKLWMRGFGLIPGIHKKFITDNEIQYLYSFKNKRRIARFIAFILLNSDSSPVTTTPDKQVQLLPSDESEENKWSALTALYDSSLNRDLYNYLEWTKLRVDNTASLKILNHNGDLETITFKKMSWGNYNMISSTLRKVVPLLFKHQIFYSNDLIGGTLLNFYNSEDFQNLSENLKDNIRNNIRAYIKYYIITNSIYDINIDRVAPKKMTNKKTMYGENINFGETQILIDALLNDSNECIDEKDITQAKCRRAILLQMTTGARIHEILLLTKDCITTNNQGEKFIHFHKTKNKSEFYVKMDSNMFEWINELIQITPNIPLEVNSINVSTTFGDDLKKVRLFPNKDCTNILLPGTINRFLLRLEKRLKLKTHFSSHSSRKIHALYLKMIGKEKVDIQHALNQRDIDSQLPYLATKSKKVVNDLKKVSLEGVWSNLTTYQEDESTIPLNQVIERSIKFQTTSSQKQEANLLVEKIVTKVKQELNQLPSNENITQPTGMPMYTHNCTATVVVNCGHTELDCFSCNKYLPDQDKLKEHKAEILRYMVLILFYKDNLKKNKLEKEFISMNIKDIEEKLKKTFFTLFSKFNLRQKEGNEIEKNLDKIAKTYYKTNKIPLSFSEALELV